jgi:hypothetical protein
MNAKILKRYGRTVKQYNAWIYRENVNYETEKEINFLIEKTNIFNKTNDTYIAGLIKFYANAYIKEFPLIIGKTLSKDVIIEEIRTIILFKKMNGIYGKMDFRYLKYNLSELWKELKTKKSDEEIDKKIDFSFWDKFFI